jgi:arginase
MGDGSPKVSLMGSAEAAGIDAADSGLDVTDASGAPAGGLIEIVTAPSNLGLRPPAPGREPGTWRAPHVLLSHGLGRRLNAVRIVELPCPRYVFQAQPGTGIRNGTAIREHALGLADAVATALAASRFVVVLGGDCSILLGCLAGVRQGGRCGLVHVDGHSDFFHPGNYDAGSSLGSAAGMDLALATGRGELLLTHWPKAGRPLVNDDDVIQIGDRDPAETGHGSLDPPIVQLTVHDVLLAGVVEVADRAIEHLRHQGLDRAWLHVDLDVLDCSALPAVDTPGRPGLTFDQLGQLLSRLIGTGRIVGLNVTTYDPELDPACEYAPQIVDCLALALTALTAPATLPARITRASPATAEATS